MSTETAAGIVLILVPVWFNVWFFALARRFEYPDILRRPTAEILERFRSGGPYVYVAWSLWLIGVGIALLV